MKYGTVIFDLDGTLLDTLQDLANSVNYVLRQFGFPERSLSEVRSFVGNGVKILLKRSFSHQLEEEDLMRALDVFRKHYAMHMNDHTGMYEGIEELLIHLHEKELNLAIVSNKLDSAVKELNQLYLKKYVPLAVGTPPERKKPDPYSVQEVMKHYNSTVNDTIYVGDSDVDIETAHNAGLKCIGVSWGFRGRKFLEEHGADFVIDHPSELLSLL